MSNIITKVCLFVNKKITKIVYTHIFYNKYLISIRIQLLNNKIINIYNIYNSCRNSENDNVIFNFKNVIQKIFKKKHVVVKNFNLHYSN